MPSLAESVKVLAAAGVCIGTSSWKYPGWLGQVYSEGRYLTRGKFSEAKFEKTCLAEYAQTFSTVCVDAAFYTFPKESGLAELAGMVPEDFRFAFKVTDEITVNSFPNIPRMGPRAGKPNPNFLNPELFTRAFLGPLETIRSRVGPIIFEFGHFHPADFAHGRDFIAALDAFLSQIPPDWQYSVEVRNKTFLHPEYFAMLRSHGVAHCFNSWTRMPPVSEQLDHEGSISTDFTTGRFLLTPGRGYEAAVKAFSPYRETQARDDDARAALQRLLKVCQRTRHGGYVYVNNRLEGNAINTIADAISRLTGTEIAVDSSPPPAPGPREGELLL